MAGAAEQVNRLRSAGQGDSWAGFSAAQTLPLEREAGREDTRLGRFLYCVQKKLGVHLGCFLTRGLE